MNASHFLLKLIALTCLIMTFPTSLLADWREDWEENGITLDWVVTLEAIKSVKGGVDTNSATLGNIDLTLELDTEKLGWWDNGTFFAYVLSNFEAGAVPTEFIGDIQATSNIEAFQTTKIYELWYEHRFVDGRLGILGGLHDYNSEFDALEYAALFTNSSFGIGPEVAQVGPSIFSTTALAVRVAYQPCEHSYILAAVYDGVPGDLDDPHGTQITLDGSEEGAFYAGEIGLTSNEDDDVYYKVAVGLWHITDFADLAGDDTQNDGFYINAERSLDELVDGLGGFIQFGHAQENRNQVSDYIGAGLTCAGVIPGRDDDVLGLAVAHATYGEEFRDLPASAGLNSSETAVELTYQAAICDHFVLQPSIQYVINPGSEPDLADALQVGVRCEISF